MESKICSMCCIEKHIKDLYKKYTECKKCRSIRSLKRYYENKKKISIQLNIKYEKNNCYRNKMVDIYILRNYLNLMLN